MTGVWITVSTRWEFANVQAALNVVISILGTIGIWAFSRFWWQRAAKIVLDRDRIVPLASLFTFTSMGDTWDVITFFYARLFTKHNWTILIQLVVVVTATLLTLFAGPLARVSLRSDLVIQSKETSVLQTSKGGGSFGSLIHANVLWNNTISSLNSAKFPLNQILEYVPSPSTPWVYRESEWDPTWYMECNHTDETEILQLKATGNHTLKDPTEAYPDFGNIFEPFWLNNSNYRREIWRQSWLRFDEDPQLKQTVYFILDQTNPDIDDQLYHNQNPLHFSLTAFHLQDVQLRFKSQQLIGSSDLTPLGIAGKASYTRTQCMVSRRHQRKDDLDIPWIWTNQTQFIVMAAASFYAQSIQDAGAHKTDFRLPSPQELLRFYQAYMSSVNTNTSPPSSRVISVRVPAVQLSCITLAIILLVFVLTVWNSGRYFLFTCVHEKARIKKVYIPDTKIQWMVHAAKNSEHFTDTSSSDRDWFRDARFFNPNESRHGYVCSSQQNIPMTPMTQTEALNAKIQPEIDNTASLNPSTTSANCKSSDTTLTAPTTITKASLKAP
jgi:hypothetical protein